MNSPHHPEATDWVARGRTLSRRLPAGWDRRVRELAKAAVDYRGFRRAYVRGFVFWQLSRTSRLVVAPFGEGQLLVDSSDGEVGRTVFMTGGYERIYMERSLRYLERQGYLTRGRTFVDIGANIGTSTVDALVRFGFHRSISFEPSGRNYELLKLNLVLNGLEDRATAFHMALSDYCGTGALELSADNPADHQMSREADRPETPTLPGAQELTPCRTFDSLVAEGVISLGSLGLVWLDTQGHELYVLRGAKTAISAGVPMVIEYWPPHMSTHGTLQPLEELIADSYDLVIDLRLLKTGTADEAGSPAGDLGPLRRRYAQSHTDLLLVRTPSH